MIKFLVLLKIIVFVLILYVFIYIVVSIINLVDFFVLKGNLKRKLFDRRKYFYVIDDNLYCYICEIDV